MTKTSHNHPDGDRSKGKGPRKFADRGRHPDAEAVKDIRSLLGTRPRDRDLLIEYLHLIQDAYGHISAAHLSALAEEMSISMAEAYEVATFYAHFDVLREDQAPPPPITVRVCSSLSCWLKGAEQLYRTLQNGSSPEQVRIVQAACMGRCDSAPVAEVGHHHIGDANEERVVGCIKAGQLEAVTKQYPSYDDYLAEGGYQLLQSCREGEYQAEEVIDLLKKSGLRGLGGAGFPAGLKCELVRREKGPRLLAVNGDEGEPGTFKDRYYLEMSPHRFLEGVLLAAWIIDAEAVYIYLRDEYPALHRVLRNEIGILEVKGLIKEGYIHLRRGAGSYICGEESAMIESIEGKRGYPRERPPYVSERGLFGYPTLVNNVETLYWLRDIIEAGPEWETSGVRNGGQGLRSYSVSGRVANPGVYLAPSGITLRRLLDQYCGGMQAGHQLKAYLPGGASGGILPASMDNLPLDFDALEEYGSFIGSAAIIVLSDQDDLASVVLNLARFFADESCGQCSPCRVGTEKMVQILESGDWHSELAADLIQVMQDASICGLGQAAANPLRSAIQYFPKDLIARESSHD